MVSETFPNSYTSPHIHSWIFKTLRVIIVYWERDIVKQPMKKGSFVPKNVPGVGWGGVGHAGVGWGASCRGGVGWKKMQPQNKGPGM